MPHVTMITQVSGSRDGAVWPQIGETLEVSEDEAAQLIATRYAVAHDADAAEVEAAVASSVSIEKAAVQAPKVD